MASIRNEHAVQSGKSNYFAEIEAVLEFLRCSASGECRVFLIDELFRGTNTVERIAAAKAVLGELSGSAQVLATTHDVELQHLLGERFAMFHFRENPYLEAIFDHRIHVGPCTTRNAIRLLERLGYPTRIVEEAHRIAAQGTANVASSRAD